MKRWVYRQADPEKVKAVAETLDISCPVAQAVVARGYGDGESARAFLNPSLKNISDPFGLPGMQAAVDRLCRAISKREKIVVFGDYDADGVTATALLVRVLRKLGATVEAFLPHRVDDGYGLSVEAAARCLEQYAPPLLVTVDCGTSAVEAVQLAAQKGTDVVITDHHLPGRELAPACAVVNPKCGPPSPARDLAGVGVAFKLCYALARQTRELTPEQLQQFLDLVAVGTIADVVPLTGENRVLAKHGLQRLSKKACCGLEALKRVADVPTVVDSWHVGFLLGPRLNAAGRLDSAQTALDLLLSDNPAECTRLADELNQANRERQEIEQRVVDEVVAEWDARFDESTDFAVVADGPGWHPGVIGIVAARLCRRYYRPAIVISVDPASDEARGSCRSIEDFDMVEHLSKCAELLERFGGHTMAAGLDIRKERIAEFRRRFNEAAAATLKGRDLRAPVHVDAVIDLSDVTEKFIADAARIEPCGVGNPKPLWAVRGVKPDGPVRVLRDSHLEWKFKNEKREIRAIGFDMIDRVPPSGPLDLVFEARMNTYWGYPQPELRVVDFKPSDAAQTGWSRMLLKCRTKKSYAIRTAQPMMVNKWSNEGEIWKDLLVVLAYVLLVARAIVSWSAGLNPPSLWHDDLWVACLAKFGCAGDMLSIKAPTPLGSLFVHWVFVHVLSDPEVSLQLPSFIVALICVPLTGWMVARVTGSRLLGILGASVLVLNPIMAAYSVRVKHYMLDYLATAVILMTGWNALREPSRRAVAILAATAFVAIIFSFTSLAVSAATVAAVCLRALMRLKSEPRRTMEVFAIAAVLAIFVGAFYRLDIQPRSSRNLLQLTDSYYLPLHSFFAATTFEVNVVKEMCGMALAASPPLAALIAAIGMAALVVDRRTRWFGCALVFLFVLLTAANAAGAYPLGLPRMYIFFFPVLILCFCFVVHTLTSHLRKRVYGDALAAVVVMAAVLISAPAATYPGPDHTAIIRILRESRRPGDVVLLHPSTGRALAYYGEEAVNIVRMADAYMRYRIDFSDVDILQVDAPHGGLPAGEEKIRGREPRRILYYGSAVGVPLRSPMWEIDRLIRQSLHRLGYGPAQRIAGAGTEQIDVWLDLFTLDDNHSAVIQRP